MALLVCSRQAAVQTSLEVGKVFDNKDGLYILIKCICNLDKETIYI